MIITRSEKEDIQLAVMFDKEFSYIEKLCETYTVNYNERLINQVLDKYNYIVKVPKVSVVQAKELVLKNLLMDMRSQYHKKYL
jgi:uncharacterized protein YutD